MNQTEQQMAMAMEEVVKNLSRQNLRKNNNEEPEPNILASEERRKATYPEQAKKEYREKMAFDQDGDRKLNKTENIIYMASQDGWQQVVSTFYATHGCKYNSSDEKFHCPKNMCAVWYTEVEALEDKLDAHSTEDELAAYNRQADAYNARCT